MTHYEYLHPRFTKDQVIPRLITNQRPQKISTGMRGMGRYQRGFYRAKPPRYTGMKKGRPTRDWMLGLLEIFRRWELTTTTWRSKLAASAFDRDAEIWWEIEKGYYHTHRFTWKEFIELFYWHQCTRKYQVILKHQDLKRERHEERLRELQGHRK